MAVQPVAAGGARPAPQAPSATAPVLPANETTPTRTGFLTADHYDRGTTQTTEGTPAAIAPAVPVRTTTTNAPTSSAWVEDDEGFTLHRAGGPASVDDAGDTEVAPASDGPGTVTPERAQEIDGYLDAMIAENPPDYGLAAAQGEQVAAAAAGQSTLGALSEAERQHLIDAALDRWLADDLYASAGTNYTAIAALAERAATDPNAGASVAQVFARRALELAADPAAIRGQATALAAGAVQAAGDAETRRGILESLGPVQAAPSRARSSLRWTRASTADR